MAALADISINDGSALVVYNPVSHDRNNVIYRDSAATNIAAASTITLSDLPTKANSTTRKVRVKLVDYFLETVSGQTYEGYVAAPKVAYANKVTIDAEISTRSTTAAITKIRTKALRAIVAEDGTIVIGTNQIVDLFDRGKKPY